MDRQEETTEQVDGKDIVESQESASSVPHDLISTILSKVPLKAVLRCRCVSKLWSSITTDPFFINAFDTRLTRKKPSLLLCFKRKDRLFVFLIPQDHPTSNVSHTVSSQPVESYHVTCPKLSSFSTTKSVRGLICCFSEAGKAVIWNPATRKFLTLTKPEKRWERVTFFLGYDPIQVKHKVLCVPFDQTIDECRVLTLGSAQESWRRIRTNHKHLLNRYTTIISHEYINGVLYYVAYSDQTENVRIVVSFDVRSEEFHLIKLPWDNSVNGRGILATWMGKLACVNSHAAPTALWILEDAEKPQWSYRNFLVPIDRYDESLKAELKFRGITDDGKFVYLPNGFYKSLFVFYYDPTINRVHRVEFRGIADDEFRLRNGLVNNRLYNISVVLNQIESLMSLE